MKIPPILNARDLLLNRKTHQNHIVTYCQELDQLLGGGIALGQVTEVCGSPGAGKTQLAMQLAVMCRLPKSFGGVEGKTLYIDAEGIGHILRSFAHLLLNELLPREARRSWQVALRQEALHRCYSCWWWRLL